MSYDCFVTTTLTFRLDKKQRAKLRSKAKALGQSESELLRKMLDRELKPRRLGDVIGHLAGAFVLKEPQKPDAWRDQMRERNWRT
jgi:Ribbon-helix-helix protein, copG family